jgi:hypothetical protein
MFSTLALCLSLHTSGPVATLAQLSATNASQDAVTLASGKPGTTKPKTGGGGGKADPKKKPKIQTPPGITRPGFGGGGPI